MSVWGGTSESEKEDNCVNETSRHTFPFDQSLYRMADRSEGESEHEEFPTAKTNESIYNEIMQLEKTKAALERRNSERQMLEKQLKDLRKNVTTLQTTTSPCKGKSPATRVRSATATSDGEDKSGNSVQSRLRSLHSKLNLIIPGTSQAADTSSDSTASSDDEAEHSSKEAAGSTNSVMSTTHKQKILDRRSDLVENMLPEDIFSDLIANKVLTTSEVTRIKEKKGREDMNEELLNNLIRKPDRAFSVLNKALRRTLQEHLAELLEDPPATPVPKKKKKKKKKQRNPGELNMTVGVEDIQSANSRRTPQCSCAEVEEQILIMAKIAYRNIRRRDETPASFEQFRKELSSTNEVIRDSMEIMNTLKVLCKHGRGINDLTFGSVRFTIQCTSVFGCEDLWRRYQSGSLLKLLQCGLVTHSLQKMFGLSHVKLGVHIAEEEYQLCSKELGKLCDNQNTQGRENYTRKCKLTDESTVMETKRVFREISGNVPNITSTRSHSLEEISDKTKMGQYLHPYHRQEVKPLKRCHSLDWLSDCSENVIKTDKKQRNQSRSSTKWKGQSLVKQRDKNTQHYRLRSRKSLLTNR